MLVKIEEIQEGGLHRTEPITPEVLAEALRESNDFTLVRASPLVCDFQRVSGQVHLQGRFEANVKAPCKRCVRDVEQRVSVRFSLRMIPEKPMANDQDEEDSVDTVVKSRRKRRSNKDDDDAAELAASFELDEVDAEPFDGKRIDLNPIVREQLLLALPLAVLCKDDCKGLCVECGQDLNDQACGHSGKAQIDPRLAKLRDIKLKN